MHVGTLRRSAPPAIALTFDDAPGECTAALLDLLAAQEAKATFFALGCELEQRPELARRIVDDGHELGNHTFSHARLSELAPEEIERELRSTSDLIEAVTAKRPLLFRPPYGLGGLAALPVARALGMTTVLWSLNPKDWDGKGAETIAQSLLDDLRPGSVVVLHDGGAERQATVHAIERCLPAILGKGLTPVRLSDLLKQSRAARRATIVRRRSALRQAIGSRRQRKAARSSADES